MRIEEVVKVFGDSNITLEEGYEYQILTSVGDRNLYQCKNRRRLTNEEYCKAHENHIISDYEEEGYEVLLSKTVIEKNIIITKLLIRKKK